MNQDKEPDNQDDHRTLIEIRCDEWGPQRFSYNTLRETANGWLAAQEHHDLKGRRETPIANSADQAQVILSWLVETKTLVPFLLHNAKIGWEDYWHEINPFKNDLPLVRIDVESELTDAELDSVLLCIEQSSIPDKELLKIMGEPDHPLKRHLFKAVSQAIFWDSVWPIYDWDVTAGHAASGGFVEYLKTIDPSTHPAEDRQAYEDNLWRENGGD